MLSLPVSFAWFLRTPQLLGAPGGLQHIFAGIAMALGILWLLLPLTQQFAQGTKWDSWAFGVTSLVATSAIIGAVLAAAGGVLGYAPGWVASYDGFRQQTVSAWPKLSAIMSSDKVLATLLGLFQPLRLA